MIIITEHEIIYVELPIEQVRFMYGSFFIITPTTTPFRYNFYRFINVPDSGNPGA